MTKFAFLFLACLALLIVASALYFHFVAWPAYPH